MLTALVLAASMLFTQQTTTTQVTAVKPNQPFNIAWDMDLSASTETYQFRWWCDAQIKKNFSASDLTVAQQTNADGTTTINASVPGLPAGVHVCTVSAFTAAFPTDMQSAALSVPAGSPAPTPKNLRILQVIVNVIGGGF